MSGVALERLTRPELLFLVKRFLAVDQRDVANARWEMAEDAASRLYQAAVEAENAEMKAVLAECDAPPARRRKLAKARAEASIAAIDARAAADRARRRAERCLKELQTHRLPERVK